MKQHGWALLLKKSVDKAVAASLLVAAGPVIAGAAIAVRVAMGRPVLFAQTRPGRGEKPFRIYKMRTMTDARRADGTLGPDSERLTRLGAFLRATSIDELPQLWNVLRGELSLVGPRPLMTEYLPFYTPEQARRHQVLPGITGWAQIRGRNTVSWEDKFLMDVWYVDHWSPLLDLHILVRTVASVIRREGISPDGAVTMPRFDDHVRATSRLGGEGAVIADRSGSADRPTAAAGGRPLSGGLDSRRKNPAS